MTLHQLSFDFTPPIESSLRPQINLSWRVVRLARQHDIQPTHAAIYASEMGLPVGGIR